MARLGHPINTTERVFVVVPAGAGHHEGFFENVHLVKKLADRLGTDLTVLVVGADGTAYAEQFERVESEAPAAFRSVPDWSDLLPLLEDESSPNDLVAVLSSRLGEVGWHDRLHDLSEQLAKLPPASFLILHRKGDPDYDRQSLRFE